MIKLKNKNILVVEDDELNFIYISQILKLADCNINWVKTGLDALEYGRMHNDLDLILLDIQLPDMSGEKVAAALRLSGCTIPIIAQTASHSGCDMEALKDSGCNDLVIKPFGVNTLLDKIKRYIEP